MNAIKITKSEKIQYIEENICKEPHIWNILQWLCDKRLCMDHCYDYGNTTYSENLIREWRNFDICINKQQIACINFVYNTIKNKS